MTDSLDGQVPIMFLATICSQTALLPAIAASKSAVSFFLLRVCIQPWQRWLLWFIIGSLTFLALFVTMINWAQCVNVPGGARAWELADRSQCWIAISGPSIALGAVSAFYDFILAILPWSVLAPLQMPRSEKKNIGISLSCTVLAGICGIVRTYYLTGELKKTKGIGVVDG